MRAQQQSQQEAVEHPAMRCSAPHCRKFSHLAKRCGGSRAVKLQGVDGMKLLKVYLNMTPIRDLADSLSQMIDGPADEALVSAVIPVPSDCVCLPRPCATHSQINMWRIMRAL